MLRASLRPGETKTTVQRLALPSSFLIFGTSPETTLSASRSVAQVRAGLYISKNARFAVTASGALAGSFLTSFSTFVTVFGGFEKADSTRAETTAVAVNRTFLCIYNTTPYVTPALLDLTRLRSEEGR